MSRASARRVAVAVWSTVALFVAALGGATALLVLRIEQSVEAEVHARIERAANGAEASINRWLMGVDALLADLGEEIGALPPPSGAAVAGALLDKPLRRSLWLRDLVLLDADARVLAAARDSTQRLGVPLPPPFVRAALAQPVPALAISSALVSPASAERALYFARPLRLPDGRAGVIVAEMPLATLQAVLGQAGLPPGVSLTLERDDGELLASAPHAETRLGQRLAGPAAQLGSAATVLRAAGRLDGAPSLVALRPTLYRHSVVAVSVATDVAFARAQRDRAAVIAVALAFAVLIVAAGAVGQRQFVGLARSRAEAQAAKATLDRALQAMPDGFLLCDASDRVQAWNPRYLEIFPWLEPVLAPGVPFEAIVDVAARAIVPDERNAAQRRAWRSMRLSIHRSGAGLYEQELAGGTVIQVVERRTPDGGIVGVFRDVGERVRELAHAKAAAGQAAEAKARFLSAMSHELRTPLNGVLGMSALLRKTPLSAQQRGWLDTLDASGRSLLNLLNDVLELARVEAGRAELEVSDFALAELIDGALAAVAGRAREKGLTLVSRIDDSAPAQLRGDVRRLRQVLLNLLGNAVKFTERGSVEVEVGALPLAARRVQLTIAVRDSGIGIEPSLMPQLFQRFTQGDAGPARRYGGSGLGLAISRELLDLMGGRIAAESRPGAGSVFYLALPLDIGAPPGAPSDLAPLDEPASLQLLVAEDNEVNQMVVRALLEQLGHRCEVVGDGAAAVRRVAEGGPDAVLMDIQMPGLDGLAATRRIRALPAPQRDTPVIALTANASADDRAAYAAAGMNGHVAKPVSAQALRAALARALPAAQASATR